MTARPEPAGLDYRWLFEALPVPLLVLGTSLVIVAANEAYQRLAAATGADLVGRTATGDLARSARAALATGRPDTMAAWRHGDRVWRPVTVPLVSAAGRVTHLLHRLDDITDPVRRAGDLSHDLRNPLTAITGAAGLLRLDLPAGHPAIGVLERQVAAMVRIVDDLAGTGL